MAKFTFCKTAFEEGIKDFQKFQALFFKPIFEGHILCFDNLEQIIADYNDLLRKYVNGAKKENLEAVKMFLAMYEKLFEQYFEKVSISKNTNPYISTAAYSKILITSNYSHYEPSHSDDIIFNSINLYNTDQFIELQRNGLFAEKSNLDICKDIVSYFDSLSEIPPSYLKNKNNLAEGDFRRDLSLFYKEQKKMSSYSTSESISNNGEVDLKVTFPNGKVVTFEFKIWPRNDYKTVTDQLLGYMTSSQSEGFIIMICNGQKSIEKKYIELVLNNSKGIVKKRIKIEKVNNYPYIISQHNIKSKKYFLYHFIYYV
jgi:hypothetical protein